MSVEDWARMNPSEYTSKSSAYAGGYQNGRGDAFSALLSDEAVEAAENAYWEVNVNVPGAQGGMRAALQAAVDAVTKGDTE